MRYFSPLEKQIVSALIGLKNPPENVFGMVMQPILFSKGKLALLVVNQGKNGMLLLPNRDLKTITTSMTEMVEFISLMEFLEKERLIYVQSFPMTCDVSLFYEAIWTLRGMNAITFHQQLVQERALCAIPMATKFGKWVV